MWRRRLAAAACHTRSSLSLSVAQRPISTSVTRSSPLAYYSNFRCDTLPSSCSALLIVQGHWGGQQHLLHTQGATGDSSGVRKKNKQQLAKAPSTAKERVQGIAPSDSVRSRRRQIREYDSLLQKKLREHGENHSQVANLYAKLGSAYLR